MILGVATMHCSSLGGAEPWTGLDMARLGLQNCSLNTVFMAFRMHIIQHFHTITS